VVGSKVLFDTNILIDYLSGVARARTELRRHQDRAISIITWLEVMAGAIPDEESRVRGFLATIRTIPINAEVADLAFVLRRQTKLKLPDAIIKATAAGENRILVTRNTRDFSSTDPSIRIPYRL